ncbi:MAG TPA: cytochrome c3 family protein [Terriglobia bacterium]|nr:cytochrome c3 family protein [Terriglobia bacterium]
MAQIFHRSTNTLSRLSIYGAAFIVVALGGGIYEINESPYFTEVNVAQPQPVPFSHKHHVSELGIDCRYCHTSVEKSSFAGVPPTYTCMSCHSQIWVNSPMLEPVRASLRTNRSIEWTRVNALPDFVYFDHSIHIKKGVGCTTCHGPIGEMPITWRANTLYMRWCLGCHRQPELYVRPRSQIFNAAYQPPNNQLALGQELVKVYKIKNQKQLTDCVTCHR